MTRFSFALLASALAGVMVPAHAADAPDWWLVYGKDRIGPAQFVDLGTVRMTGDSATISTLAVDAAGGTESGTTKIRCAGTPEPRSLPAFICGSQAYRQKNGLNIRDFPPAELARIYFKTRAG